MRIFFGIVALVYFVAANACLAAPSDEEFRNALTTCAAGSKTTFSANLVGSIADIYKDGKEKVDGSAEHEVQSYFLQSLPEAQRLEGYRLFIECIRDLLKAEDQSEIIGTDDAQKVLAEVNDRTPLSRLISRFGEPYKLEVDALTVGKLSLDFHMFSFGQKDDPSFFFVFTDPKRKNKLYSAGVMKWPRFQEEDGVEGPDLQIPFLHMSICSADCEQDVSKSTLNELTISDIDCGIVDKSFNDLNIDARYLYFTADNCYFGRPGSYKTYGFAFHLTSPVVKDSDFDKCFPENAEKERDLFASKAKISDSACISLGKINPFLAIAGDSEGKITISEMLQYTLQVMFWSS